MRVDFSGMFRPEGGEHRTHNGTFSGSGSRPYFSSDPNRGLNQLQFQRSPATEFFQGRQVEVVRKVPLNFMGIHLPAHQTVSKTPFTGGQLLAFCGEPIVFGAFEDPEGDKA